MPDSMLGALQILIYLILTAGLLGEYNLFQFINEKMKVPRDYVIHKRSHSFISGNWV